MTAASTSPDRSAILCHNCGKEGHNRSGCAVPAKAHGKSNKPAGQKKKSGSGGSAGQMWCYAHKTTTHNDAECYGQGLRAHRQVVCTRQLRWEPKPAPMTPKISRLSTLTTTLTEASHFNLRKYNMDRQP